MDRATMFNHLHALQPGQPAPSEVYILDYADGSVPAWIVESREDIGAGGVKLVLYDAFNANLFDRLRVMILTFPTKTIRTPIYQDAIPGTACDLLQQHKHSYHKRKAL